MRAEDADKLKRGERVVRVRFGVDDEICTGDHSCIRLSGCPSLTVKPNPDPLRSDPVATVIESCVGCGLCGEVAACRRPVSLVLSRRDHPQSELVGSHAPSRAPDGDRLAGRRTRRGAGMRYLLAFRLRRAPPGTRVDDAMNAPQVRPITILIAALGGEGGGVLTDWIVTAAAQLGFPVQSTSIPGVAQRTGATTYYIEIVPVPARELGGRPVLALAPGIGDVDIVLASELMEAGRTIAGGFVTPDRTLVIASTARSYLVVERMAMADGRYDSARLIDAIEAHSQTSLLLDMETLAKQSGAMINAIMLGIIAGCGRLPIPATVFESAIRADGKAVDANLKGFRSGLEAAQKTNVTVGEGGAAKRGRLPASSVAISNAASSPTCHRPPVTSFSKAPGGSSAIRTSPMRGSISIAWRRCAPRMSACRPAGNCCARSRGISRCACPTRT